MTLRRNVQECGNAYSDGRRHSGMHITLMFTPGKSDTNIPVEK